ncbi:MAG: hypothetical protein V4685_09285 [Bacteroidota bacterium]
MKKLQILLLIFICLKADAQNDSINDHSKNYLSIELDPGPFILGGYSFSLKYSPEKLKQVTFMASVYSSKFPNSMMGKTNYEKGFRNMKMKTSYAFFADYFIKPGRSGFHFGPSVFFYDKSVGLSSSAAVANFKSIYPNIRAGYVYRPFKKIGFYVNPWINFGKEFVVGNNNSIEGRKFTINTMSYVAAIHFGYQITF